jgi:polyisoprenoid-binding protein YceI
MLRKIIYISLIFILAVFIFCEPLFAGTFLLQNNNSAVIFKVQHLYGYAVGFFSDFSGSFSLNDNNSQILGIESKIDVRSLDTQNSLRDQTLRSSLFFDADKFPEATFISTKIEADKVIGNMTIRGITKPVTFTMSLQGVKKDPAGLTSASIVGQATINRKDFGITFNKKTPQGQPMYGDDITLILDLTGILKP